MAGDPILEFAAVQGFDGTCYPSERYNDRLLGIPFIVLVIFDSVTMLTTLVGLSVYDTELPWGLRIFSVLGARNMGYLSAAFLRSGQIYYV